MPEKKKEKIVYVCSINCPSCNSSIDVLKQVKVIAPAEKAVKEERFYAAKNTQTTLDDAEADATDD
jgi:hypothetical protein